MKPKKLVKNIVIQWFIFNIILLIIFWFVLLQYIYPEYLDIENKKNDLVDKNKIYKNLEIKGIDYKKFKDLNSKYGKDFLANNIYLKNILKEFDESTFDSEFKIESKWLFLKKCKVINNWDICTDKLKKYLTNSKNYDLFLDNKKKDINEKKIKFEKNWINEKISKIVPYYTEDSSIDNNSLTDFKFINYLENLLDKFNLTYKNQIWISDLVLEESFNWSIDKKKIDNNWLDSKIYYFPLKLQLYGAKRDIVNFIYYIQNVWRINFINWNISVYSEVSKMWNNHSFSDMQDYFYPNKDFYNNLFFDIKKISISEYIDSSDDPASKEYLIDNNLWWFIKDTQWSEKLKIDLDLRFYVKWMPVYKMKNFISKVEKKYFDLVKISNLWNNFIKANKANLRDFSEIKAMRWFKRYGSYLIWLKKKIINLNKISKNWLKISEKYKMWRNYDKIFNSINKDFIRDLNILSNELFEKNKHLLWIKQKK